MTVEVSRSSHFNSMWSQRILPMRAVAAFIQARLPSGEQLAELPPASRYLLAGLGGLIVLVFIATVAAIITVEVSAKVQSSWFETRASTTPNEGRHNRIYDHVTARPVFARNRQATAVTYTPESVGPSMNTPAAAALDPNVVLRGVLISGPLEKAFITSPQNPTGRWVQLNGEIDGWRLTQVKPGQVTLEGQGQTLALKRSVVGK